MQLQAKVTQHKRVLGDATEVRLCKGWLEVHVCHC